LSVAGGPALRLLLRLKLRGLVRKQARRLKTAKGLFLGLVGGGLFAVWIGSLVLNWILDPRPPEAGAPIGLVRFAALGLTLLTVTSALSHRGLFVPGAEIERLFAAPVARADLVRYRLLVNVGRGALGGLILGLVMMRHVAQPVYAFIGTFVALETLPLVGQIVAMWSGAIERKAYARVKLLRGLALPLGILVGAGVAGLAIAGQDDMGSWMSRIAGESGLLDVANHPVMQAVTAPFAPWANAIAATTASQFALWLGVSLLIWVGLYELAARVRVDYRELSLQTASDVAERLRRMRSVGGGASGGKVSARAVGRRVPWLFGRGAGGAVAWRKLGSILRKARGTLLISTLVLVFVILLSRMLFGHDYDDAERMGGQALVAFLGLLYLGGGLRFDFRDELDRMESIKAWPLSSRRVFFAMLLPEVLLIAVLIGIAVLIVATLSRGVEPFTLALLVTVPLLAFAWIALDNAVFLFAPVRMVPGQEGALQNAGRGILLLLLRFVLVLLVGGLVALASTGTWFALDFLGARDEAATFAGFCAGWLTLLAVDVGLNELGAWSFRRFDVARDRG
jgi:hypothetical protein